MPLGNNGGWARPEQQEQWISIAEYDPYLVKGEDQEFARLRLVLEAKLQAA